MEAAARQGINVRVQSNFEHNCGVLANPCNIQPQLEVIKSSAATVVVLVMGTRGNVSCVVACRCLTEPLLCIDYMHVALNLRAAGLDTYGPASSKYTFLAVDMTSSSLRDKAQTEGIYTDQEVDEVVEMMNGAIITKANWETGALSASFRDSFVSSWRAKHNSTPTSISSYAAFFYDA